MKPVPPITRTFGLSPAARLTAIAFGAALELRLANDRLAGLDHRMPELAAYPAVGDRRIAQLVIEGGDAVLDRDLVGVAATLELCLRQQSIGDRLARLVGGSG